MMAHQYAGIRDVAIGGLGSRPCQGLFLYHSCGLRYSVYLDGARNILKRALGYIPSTVAPPDRNYNSISELITPAL